MLFRPSFCANCGDKIERAEWHIWTSRRFCGVCETEFKGQDLIPRVLIIGSLILGLSAGGYMLSGKGGDSGAKQPRRLVDQPISAKMTAANLPTPTQQNVVSAPNPDVVRESNEDQKVANVKRSVSFAEPAYFCGAATKKGTPCTRRVKGNVRCYQHVGMPAMVSGDKLKAG